MQTTLKRHVENVLRENRKGMHVDNIAQHLIDNLIIKGKDKETLSNSISAALSSDLKKFKSKSVFRKIKNKQGGLKRGFYKVRAERIDNKAKSLKVIEMQGRKTETVTKSSNNVGSAGEHLVFSELLFRDFNAAVMDVDDGIDLVCFKNDKFFFIQVKTANLTETGKRKKFLCNIKTSQFKKHEHHNPFYIVVLRHSDGRRTLHDFVILPSNHIAKFIEQGVIKPGGNMLNLSMEVVNNKLYLNTTENIDYYFNRFDLIK